MIELFGLGMCIFWGAWAVGAAFYFCLMQYVYWRDAGKFPLRGLHVYLGLLIEMAVWPMCLYNRWRDLRGKR
ncbi:MAG: hypothetical protein GY851_03445 [bacterium]|nr:hypothetical protein [bacterium]